MEYSGTTGWRPRYIEFQGNEVLILFKDLETPFYWSWKVKDRPTFSSSGKSKTLNQMYAQLLSAFDIKSKLKSNYRKEYSKFVSLNWFRFIKALLDNIHTSNDFLVFFLDELSRDINDNIRLAVAKHPFTPESVLLTIRNNDPLSLIRVSADNSMEKSLLISYSKLVTLILRLRIFLSFFNG